MAVDVAVALGRPPGEHEWRHVVVDETSEVRAEELACMIAGSHGCVMPVTSHVVDVLEI